MLPLVSVIIPNYNYSIYLKDCVNSILNQDYPALEVIVVDDGSTDNSLRKLSEFGKSIKVIESSNFGVNHARNLGLKASTGELVAFCDSDDWWERSKISTQVNLMEDNLKLALVYTGINIVSNDMTVLAYHEPKYRGRITNSIVKFPARALIQGGSSSALIRRNAIESQNITWNETLRLPGEDINFFNKIALKFEVDYIDLPLVNYRQHEESRSQMKVRSYMIGNLESFIDFAKFAASDVQKYRLYKMWTKLNVLLVKHAVLHREWILMLQQLKYFLRSYSSSR